MDDARALIDRLGLAPHPEGGWYRETWRADAAAGARAAGTAILFLLEQGQRSHWHRVDATEIWFWHAGHPLRLLTAPNERGPGWPNGGGPGRGGTVSEVLLGGDIMAGQSPQALVPADHWQATQADAGWGLVSCTVTPGFDFAGFTLAPPGWAPDA